MAEQRIKLNLTPSGWMADFCGDPEIFKLFGTTVLPTAFTAAASAATVIAATCKLNPTATVTFA